LVFNKDKFVKFVSFQEFLPSSFTSYKNKIGLATDDEYLSENKDVVLNWPYKDCILEGGQDKEDVKRNEVFHNEILAPDEIDKLLDPKVFTNFKKYNRDGEHGVAEVTMDDNLILEGNNLLCLHSILGKYRKKIKVIYIDPPYNPKSASNTFNYNNSFNRSTWLTFMKNRLEVAKELLSDQGILVTAIDDNEVSYLRVLLDELYPQYTHETVVVNHHPQGSGGLNISATHEYAIFTIPKGKRLIKGEANDNEEEEWPLVKSGSGNDYFRIGRPNMFFAILVNRNTNEVVGIDKELSSDGKYSIEDNNRGYQRIYPIDSKGMERRWRYGRETMESLISDGKIVCSKNGVLKVKKSRKDAHRPVYSNWLDSRYNAGTHGTRLVDSLTYGEKFSFPKSLYTVLDAIKYTTWDTKDAIILDFFGGSGTTAQAVLDLNKVDGGSRKFILIEQMDYIKNITVKRVHKVIEKNNEGSFIYAELKDNLQDFIDKLNRTGKEQELADLLELAKKSSFLSYKVNPRLIDTKDKDFKKLSITEKKKILLDLVDKNYLYVNYSDIDNADFKVSEEDKKLNKQFYGNE